jgi:hypothetical protein
MPALYLYNQARVQLPGFILCYNYTFLNSFFCGKSTEQTGITSDAPPDCVPATLTCLPTIETGDHKKFHKSYCTLNR